MPKAAVEVLTERIIACEQRHMDLAKDVKKLQGDDSAVIEALHSIEGFASIPETLRKRIAAFVERHRDKQAHQD